jgi:hypothetical protein
MIEVGRQLERSHFVRRDLDWLPRSLRWSLRLQPDDHPVAERLQEVLRDERTSAPELTYARQRAKTISR